LEGTSIIKYYKMGEGGAKPVPKFQMDFVKNTGNFNEEKQEYFLVFLTKPFCQWHVMRYA
jgi:hypothetical protein